MSATAIKGMIIILVFLVIAIIDYAAIISCAIEEEEMQKHKNDSINTSLDAFNIDPYDCYKTDDDD